MIYKYIHKNNEIIKGIRKIKKDYESKAEPEKERILAFMRKHSNGGVCASKVHDDIKDQSTDITEHLYFYNEYAWNETDIYHFEKYNIKLSDDFINIALNN